MKNLPPLYPNRLREWRQVHDLTLAEVAAKMRVSVTTIARHETHNNGVTLLQLMKYARIYKVRVEELLPAGSDPEPKLVAILQVGLTMTDDERDQLYRIAVAIASPKGKPPPPGRA